MNSSIAASLGQDRQVRSASTLLFSLILLAGAAFVSWKGLNPPGPVASTDTVAFSASRAAATLSTILGDGSPHPTGTASNTAVRERIVDQLRKYGYEPRIQSAFTCSSSGACAQVNNIVAALAGESTPDVLVAAHYDSVPAGPGASDDGSGAAAVLEIARALKSAPTLRHSVIFLIDDGEELGLLGAKAFFEQNPLAHQVRWAVNMEARGTSGPSLMFETSSGNKDLIRLFAEAVPHPVTNSLLYEIYRKLPNDTDFTIFKAHHVEGLNLAFIGNASQYHRPGDSLANLSAASLQDQGNHALALTLALANGPDDARATENDVFFDLLGILLISWPVPVTLPLVGLAVVLVVLSVAILRRRKKVSASSLLRASATWLGVIVIAAIASLFLGIVLERTAALPAEWGAHPFPAAVAFVALAVVVSASAARHVVRREIIWAFLVVNAAGFSLLSLALFSSGAVYVFLVAAMSSAIALAVTTRGASDESMALHAAAVLPAVLTALIWVAMLRLFYDALGTLSLPLIAVFSAVLLTPLLAVASATMLRRILIGSAVLTVIAAGSMYVIPRYSKQAPLPLNIIYHQDAGSGASQWILTDPGSDRALQSLLHDAGLKFTRSKPYPWAPWPMLVAPGTGPQLPAPVLESMQLDHEQEYLGVSGRLRSVRGANQAVILFSPQTKLKSAVVGGVAVPISPPALPLTTRQWRRIICVLPPQGVDIRIVFDSQHAQDVYIEDESFGLPDAGRRLALARPDAAAPIQDGDVTLVSRRLSDIISSAH